MWRWCGENANCANFPNSGFVFGLLTSIFIWPFVFDISGELCKYVVPRCVGFPILWCKFGIPKKHEHGVSEDVPRLVLFSFLRVWGILWWNQHLLQVLLYFVDVSENLPLEGEEGRVCTRGQVVKVSRFPKWSRIILLPLLLNCDEMPLCFFCANSSKQTMLFRLSIVAASAYYSWASFPFHLLFCSLPSRTALRSTSSILKLLLSCLIKQWVMGPCVHWSMQYFNCHGTFLKYT